MNRRGRRLPMVGPPDKDVAPLPDDEVGGGSGTTRPDPERIKDGWKHRFVAAGARAEEMIEAYRELGYEVAADPVLTHGLMDGCVECLTGGQEPYWSIYTRRPEAQGSPDPSGGPGEPAGEPPAGEAHPTRVLREEHQQILQVAGVLERLLDSDASDAVYDRIAKCIRFIRLFADACHHGKEEDLLFPALEEQGMPRDSGPIAVMLGEHRLGRQFASTMADSIDDARAGDAAALRRLTRAGRDYVDLIRGHILKEDNVLFNMADQLVTGPRCARLCEAYDETSAHAFEDCTKRELEALGREIVAGG